MKKTALKDFQDRIRVASTVNPGEDPVVYPSYNEKNKKNTTFKPQTVFDGEVFKHVYTNVNRVRKGGLQNCELATLHQAQHILLNHRPVITNPSLLIELKSNH